MLSAAAGRPHWLLQRCRSTHLQQHEHVNVTVDALPAVVTTPCNLEGVAPVWTAGALHGSTGVSGRVLKQLIRSDAVHACPLHMSDSQLHVQPACEYV